MNDLICAAKEIQDFLEVKNWDFCFIGGLAVQHWGEPRVTQDVDLSILTGFGGEEVFIDTLSAVFRPRIDNAREFALQNRVLLLYSSSGIGLDIALGGLPFEELAVTRGVYVKVASEVKLKLCSAEDLIIFKSFASRAIDWHDVKTIIERQGRAALDWHYIEKYLQPLAEAKEEPQILEELYKLKHQN